MKHIKVPFLFFLVIFFLSCKKEAIIENNRSTENSTINVFFTSSDYKKLNYKERLHLSKKILNEEILTISDKYVIFNNLSFLYSKERMLDSSIFFSRKMLDLSIVKNNVNLKGKTFFKLGNYFNKLNKKDSAYFYFFMAKKSFLQTTDSLQTANALINLAIIESDFGSYSTSDSIAVESLRYLNRDNESVIAKTYNCLAINSKKRDLFEDAISYYKKASDLSNSKNSIIKYKNNIANVYKEQKEYSKSISILENLLKDSITNKKTKATIIDNLAYTKWLNESREDVLNELLLAESIRILQNDNYGLIASYSHLSEYFISINKPQSLFYANKMYEVSKKVKATNGILESIDIIVALETPQKSIKYYKESIYLRDSLQEVETKRQHKFAKIKYNYEEEEKQKLKFKTLATESKLVAEQENSQKKNVLIVTTLSISSLLFFIYRRKQQHKKQVLQENYNTETRIARRLHDELGNGIYNIITKVQNPKFKNKEIINDLDKIYLKTRAISHENDTVETGANFEDYFKDLIAGYNSDTCKIILKDLSSLDLNNLSKTKQIVVYRVFNELFVNMKKHSKASIVVLSCKKTNNNLEMNYADNGVGFKGNSIVLKNGLKNMETRIKSINGIVNFENKPTKGLKVSIHFKN